MEYQPWAKELSVAITVCDRDGIILEMNDAAVETFRSDGGAALVGKNALDCHPEPARSQLAQLLADRSANVYTIEKNGVKKLIYQVPWYCAGEFGGLVEFSLKLPADIPHFVRAP